MKSFILEIVNLDQPLQSFEITSLEVETVVGKIAFLADRSSFRGILKPGPVIFTTSAGEKKSFEGRGGVLKVGGNRAELLS